MLHLMQTRKLLCLSKKKENHASKWQIITIFTTHTPFCTYLKTNTTMKVHKSTY